MSTKIKVNILLVVLSIVILISISVQCVKAMSSQKESNRRNAYVVLMPLIELRAESGLAYETAIATHYDLLTMAVNDIEKHKPSLISKLLPSSSIDLKKLKKLQQILKHDPDKDTNISAHDKIEKARELALEILVEIKGFLNSTSVYLEQEDIPIELQERVAKALAASCSNVTSFMLDLSKEPFDKDSIVKAEIACESNRKAISLIVIGSLMFQRFFSDEDLQRMREDIDRAIYGNNILRKSNTFGSDVNNRLESYSHSEYRRRDIVQALIEGKIEQAKKLLLAAMHEAISKAN